MRIPYSWLSEFVDLDGAPPERVAELLTLRTCEVDGIHRVGEGLEALVVGRVVEAGPHPNADALRVTKVDVGAGELLPIVCGAPNVAAGQKVAVAVPGTRLPGGLEIGERKIRGEISRGMICSEKELGLGEDHDGILVLDEDARVGAPFVSLPSVRDAVLEIDNKSVNHRPDLWGIVGFARELGAILGRPLRPPAGVRGPGPEGPAFPVAIGDARRCSRYLAAPFEGIRVGSSPAWMARRLRLAGARPISNVVDVTNYVMFEIGEPTHAFDRAKLRGGRIEVRAAMAGESLVTLDGETRRLVPSDLLICDGEGPVGLAGVMGGADSEVDERTTAIVLEAAAFDAVAVRRTAGRLSLRSEASARFEKSLDPNFADLALARIRHFAERGLFGPQARLAGPVTVAGGPLPARPTIALSWSFVAGSLGAGPDKAAAERNRWGEILRSLDVELAPTPDPDVVSATIPTFRATKDLLEPIDLVEEIARLRGYENVVPRALEAPVAPPPSQGERRALVRRAEDRLVSLGFRGLESYSFLSDALVAQLGIASEPFVTIRNSLVVDQARVRREVLPSLLGLVARNLEFEKDLRLFEVGKGYRPENPREDPYVGADAREPREIASVAAIVARPRSAATAGFQDGVFFVAKGHLAAFLTGLGLDPHFRERSDADAAAPYLHPRRLLLVEAVDRTGAVHRLGHVGELHPRASAALGLEGAEVAGFEIDLDRLEAACVAAGPRRLVPIPRFPGITVDVALAAPEKLSVAALEELVRGTDSKLCRAVSLFDLYRGAELGAGVRSAAFHVELRADERTLSESDEAGFLRALAARAKGAGASLRGWSA